MAQTVEEIAEILNTMRDDNERNNENFVKVLTDINAKLALMSSDENIDNLKLYISELKKILEDKFITVSISYDEIHKNLSNLLSYNDELAKADEVKLLFSTLNDTFEKYAYEVHNGKDVLNNIENKVTEIGIKSVDRDEIVGLVQKVSSDLLSVSSNVEKSFLEVAEIIKRMDISGNFENLADSVNDIKQSFENNSKMNYENIINEINNLKSEILLSINSKENNEKFEQINVLLNDLITNVQFLMDLSSQNSSELSGNISSELEAMFAKFNSELSSNSELNYGEIKALVESVSNEIRQLKKDNINSENSKELVISNYFNSLKSAFENISGLLNSLQDNILQFANGKSEDVVNAITNLSLQIQNISDALPELSGTQQIGAAINELAEKVEKLNNDNSDEKLTAVQEAISKLSSELNLAKLEYEHSLKENNEEYFSKLDVVQESVGSLKQHIADVVESLKTYISEAAQVSSDNREIKYTDLVQKLNNVEASLIQATQDYEYKSENLQAKLSEFVQLLEGSNADTESKIESSLDEIAAIKAELLSLSDILKSLKISNDEKSSETISLIDAGIENIILVLNNSVDEIKNGSEGVVKELVENFDKKIVAVNTLISELNEKDNSSEILNKISETALSLNSELKLISTDIFEALQAKSEDMIRAFQGIKDGIDEFTGFDIEKILEALKTQLETSFLSFSMDVNKELISHSESFSNLEQAYKNSLDKISIIEECVTEKIQNDIELINLTFEKNIADLKSSFGEKLDEQIQDVNNTISLLINNTKILDSIDGIKNSLIDKIDSLSGVQSLVSVKQDEIQDGIDKLAENMKTFIGVALQKIVDKAGSNASEIIGKIGQIQDSNSVISNSLNEISAKLDVFVMDSSSDELQSRFDAMEEVNKQLDDKINTLNSLIAANTLSDEIKLKLDKVSDSEDAISGVVESLNAKLDAIAADGSIENLLYEVDELKNIIVEKHKTFEESSDGRLAAIDSYLKDVLVKLDNVDIEKNAEDIKETVMSALISAINQISFIEESEDIKDFVEVRTDEINKNIIEVQKQLKQLSTSDDAFDYTYTLQDVESDIAKLRLAIKNLQSSDYSTLSDEIHRIVDAVDSLETSLTQDEMIDLKANIENLNEDILSISVRTNKLLLNSDESTKALTDGLNNFSEIIYKLEDRINNLDTKEVTSRIENKLDRVHSMAVASENMNKVFHQALMYLGEWVDITTENISSVSDKTVRIPEIENEIVEIKNSMPKKDEILSEIKEVLPDNNDLVERLVSKFQLQEERIDILENKIEKILSTLEEKNDTVLNRKVDKIEKMLSKLGTNIEKLTSYVDE